MRKYDTTFIIDGSLPTDRREAIIAQYENSLTRHGAEIEQTVRWGLRQLAYEIKKQTHGYYVIIYYNADPSILTSFHREFDLNENIFRYMTMLWDGKHPHYVRDEGAPDSTRTSVSTDTAGRPDKTDEETLVEKDPDEAPAAGEEQDEAHAVEESPEEDKTTGEDAAGGDDAGEEASDESDETPEAR